MRRDYLFFKKRAISPSLWTPGSVEALPEGILEEMDIELIDFGIFRLATGNEVELPVFWGKVVVGDYEMETWFIPGDSLLGMEFFSLAGSFLSLDFGKEEVELAG
jgi:hypothetical protein